ncbi:hypothetical protein [Oceanibacterium hippocampi]|uniref:Uncharacterized protein n=1 Tax=Oceanibacterium hippocampi TaxID=745714 RepID=A0A1Y5U3E1_9PROT|nr:hypothetical protein [Oceanibacterium hippocampi]SLN77524.1 hypothetical protein OCH7691_04441 [Oceanibacterium hippocampi]
MNRPAQDAIFQVVTDHGPPGALLRLIVDHAPAGIFATTMRQNGEPFYGLGPEDWRTVVTTIETAIEKRLSYEEPSRGDDQIGVHRDHLRGWLLKCRGIEFAADRTALAGGLDQLADELATRDPGWSAVNHILSVLFEETYP